MKIELKSLKNGYIITVSQSQEGGEYVFKNTEELSMLEFIGRLILDKKVVVKER